MGHSRAANALKHLDALMARKPLEEDISTMVTCIIRKAYDITDKVDDAEVRRHKCVIEGMVIHKCVTAIHREVRSVLCTALRCPNTTGQPASMLRHQLLRPTGASSSQVGWRAKYFHCALRMCFETMEPGRLVVLLAAMTKGSPLA